MENTMELPANIPAISFDNRIRYSPFVSEEALPAMMELVGRDLSEPYSIYTYRYFLQLPHSKFCFLANDVDNDALIGTIICKMDRHRGRLRGYIGMLAVDMSYRKRGLGSHLVQLAIEAMREHGADEVVLEAEVTNKGALSLYQNLGFVRDKRLQKYYLNGLDAFRLKFWLGREEDLYS